MRSQLRSAKALQFQIVQRGSQGIWALGFQAAFALLQTICSLPGLEAGFQQRFGANNQHT